MGLFEWLFGNEQKRKDTRKRVFISFAIEDIKYRDYLVDQAKKNHSPFDLIDMSAKQAWKEDEWKRRCKTKIKRCDCMIVLLSNYTWHATGVRWEIKCAKQEGVRIIGMHIRKNDKRAIPPELRGCKIIEWSWDNLAYILN